MPRGIKNKQSSNKDKATNSKIKQSLQIITDFWKIFHARADKLFSGIGKKLYKWGFSANFLSITGFFMGLLALNFLALESFGYALLFILLNRLFDILDGAVAKNSKITEFGIFLDACLDYIFYLMIIFGFALADNENALAASFLLFAFASSACAMLSYAVISYKNNPLPAVELKRSPFYLAGAAQGFETFIAFVILCIFPGFFIPVAIVFGILCLIKAVSLIVTGYFAFVVAQKNK